MKFKLSDISSMKYGSLPKHKSVDGQYPIFTGYKTSGYSDEFNVEDPEIVVVARGVGGTGDVKMAPGPAWITNLSIILRVNPDLVNKKYLQLKLAGMGLRYLDSGSAQSQITIKDLSEVKIDLPDLDVQTKVAKTIQMFEDKISNLQAINDNLLYIAEAIFKQKFPNIEKGQKSVKDYLLPKRGKGLLAKDARPGNIPVIAGGLSPATKHDIANTKAPVVTISASGANAGYINIWLEPVWSSDSSFIDSTITENVYFWYVLLKSRQQEIFDMQTGSAQPHIYPKHIGIMPIREISTKDILEFNHLITPFFNTIANNLEEISTLSTIRDVLLKKMLS